VGKARRPNALHICKVGGNLIQYQGHSEALIGSGFGSRADVPAERPAPAPASARARHPLYLAGWR
jgi:hypothetical protein